MSIVTLKVQARFARFHFWARTTQKKTPTSSRSAIFGMNNSIQLGDFHEIFSGIGKCRLEGEQPQLGALLTMVINRIMMVTNHG